MWISVLCYSACAGKWPSDTPNNGRAQLLPGILRMIFVLLMFTHRTSTYFSEWSFCAGLQGLANESSNHSYGSLGSSSDKESEVARMRCPFYRRRHISHVVRPLEKCRPQNRAEAFVTFETTRDAGRQFATVPTYEDSRLRKALRRKKTRSSFLRYVRTPSANFYFSSFVFLDLHEPHLRFRSWQPCLTGKGFLNRIHVCRLNSNPEEIWWNSF